MRSIIAASSLVVLLIALGCNFAPHKRELVGGGGAVETATPTVDNLVKYLNENAKLLDKSQALRCTNVHIEVRAERGGGGIDGMMLCQMPRNLRLAGKLLGNPFVDIGSNDKEFWYWISKNEPPYLFHCSYEAMARGARVPFPFHPDMVMEALGLAQYDPARHYELKKLTDKRGVAQAFELSEQTVSAQNQRIVKVTKFNAQRASLPQPQVLAHYLKDERGNLICAAEIRKVQQVGDKGLIVPKEVAFRWPEQKLQMTMQLWNPQVVPVTETMVANGFTRQNLTYQAYDLATGTLDRAGVQQAGATSRVYQR
jgi:hypothetical protein